MKKRKRQQMAEEYLRLFEEFTDDNKWLKLYDRFLDFLSGTDAIMLSLLMNQSNLARGWFGKNWDGWFYCRIGAVEKRIKMNRQQQARSLNHLKSKKLILYKRKGMPPKRFFKINIAAIIENCRASMNREENDMDDIAFDEA